MIDHGMNSQFAHDLELLFWSLLFAIIGLGWMAYEARMFIYRLLVGETLPEPDKDCRIMRELPDDEVGEWHLPQLPKRKWIEIEIEGGGPYDFERIESDLKRLRDLGGMAMFAPQP